MGLQFNTIVINIPNVEVCIMENNLLICKFLFCPLIKGGIGL